MPICSSCNKEIRSKEDANVLALFGLIPKTFCNDCYSSRERGIMRNYIYYPSRFPLNSTMFFVLLIIGTIILLAAIALLLFGSAGTPAIVNGQETTLSGGFKVIISAIILVILIWNWILFSIAKSKLSELS